MVYYRQCFMFKITHSDFHMEKSTVSKKEYQSRKVN